MKGIIVWIGAAAVGFAWAGTWERSVTGSLTSQRGNTQLASYALGISTEYVGDIEWGGISLKDSELKFGVSHARGRLDNALYENDASASFLMDVMAHQTFSPFFLSYWAYDSTTALEKRVQLGAGGKYTIGGGVSVSLAYLWEIEDFENEAVVSHYRLSLRPKYKKEFENGIKLNHMIFIQPLVSNFSDFLIDNQFTLTLPTLSEKLKITVAWRDQFNSEPPEDVKNRDTDVKVGITILF